MHVLSASRSDQEEIARSIEEEIDSSSAKDDLQELNEEMRERKEIAFELLIGADGFIT